METRVQGYQFPFPSPPSLEVLLPFLSWLLPCSLCPGWLVSAAVTFSNFSIFKHRPVSYLEVTVSSLTHLAAIPPSSDPVCSWGQLTLSTDPVPGLIWTCCHCS